MRTLLEQSLVSIHLLSSAAWFGALVYRTMFVDPKSKQFLGSVASFESYSLHLAHGMRYVVMAALVSCGGSGLLLMQLRQPAVVESWASLMALKSLVWTTAFVIFLYISWRYWPNRTFAIPAEVTSLHRQGLWLSLAMIGLAAAGMVLGQFARSIAVHSS